MGVAGYPRPAMADLTSLPPDLPEPQDDGASDHLVGLPLPRIELQAAAGGSKTLNEFPTRLLVLYVYPRTGGPGVELSDDWDMIPGARGCTPQSCAFRDHHGEFSALDATVWGLSAQPVAEQEAFAERMHVPFPLLNDTGLALSWNNEAGGMTLYRRLTLIADASGIARVFYPVFPPDRNAIDVITHLERAG